MTIQQTERAREILARAYEARMWPTTAAEIRRGEKMGEVDSAPMIAVLEALTPQTSEEVVEAVARALCNRGHTIDRYSYALPEIKDYWRRQAEAAIAAMPSIPQESDAEVTEARVKHMVERFLGWRLPENFNPDAGISFEPKFNVGTPHEMSHNPTGTNLFDYTQATAMVRYMLEGL